MTGLDPERVVSLYDTINKRSGSGYLLTPSLVLTAAHCVSGVGSRAQVRALKRQRAGGPFVLTEPPEPFEVALTGWSNGPAGPPEDDLALLRWVRSPTDSARGGDPADPFGLTECSDGRPAYRLPLELHLGRPIPGGSALSAETLGFPDYQKGPSQYINTEHAVGRLDPMNSARASVSDGGIAYPYLEFDVRSGSPAVSPKQRSLWSGASGSALFSGPHLVGIITQDRALVDKRLRAAPIEALFHLTTDRGKAARRLVEAENGPRQGEYDLELIWSHSEALEISYHDLPDDWSAADLLRARYEVVPFVGRADHLRRMEDWCTSEPRTLLTLLWGAGAVGKTRLALELCRSMASKGWVAGTLSSSAADVRHLLELPANLLIVIDDADLRVGHLDAVLSAARTPSRKHHVRVLAEARTADDWWDAVRRRYDALVDSAFVIELGAPPEPDRVSLYKEARHSFASRYGDRGRRDAGGRLRPEDMGIRADDPVLTARPDGEEEFRFLQDPEFENYLLILIQALVECDRFQRAVAGDGTSQPRRDSRADALFDQLLDLERGDWVDKARNAHLSQDATTLERVVAVSSMAFTGSMRPTRHPDGTGEIQAAELLKLVPDLADASAEVRHRIARWEHGLYSGPGFLRALQPQRLAECLAARFVRAFPETVSALVNAGDSDDPAISARNALQAATTLKLLTNSLYNEPGDEEAGDPLLVALENAMAKRLTSLVTLALNAVQTTCDSPNLAPLNLAGKALITALEELIAELVRLHRPVPVAEDAAKAVGEECPDPLLQLAIMLEREAIDALTKNATRSPEKRADLGDAYKRLSRHLAESGERWDAHEIAWKAVEQLQLVLRISPEPDHELRYAHALTNLAVRLDDVGHFEDSLIPAKQAVDIYERLPREGDLGRQPIHHAMALCNWSRVCGHTGKWREGLRLASMAAAVLAEYDTVGDEMQYELDAASAYTYRTLAQRQADADQYDEVIVHAETARDLYACLRESRGETWDRDEAYALNVLGCRHSEVGALHAQRGSHKKSLGHHRASYRCHEEAVERFESLEHDYREAVRTQHAEALSDLAHHHLRFGRDAEQLRRRQGISEGGERRGRRQSTSGSADRPEDDDGDQTPAPERLFELGWNVAGGALEAFEKLSDQDQYASRSYRATTYQIRAELALELGRCDAGPDIARALTLFNETSDNSWMGRRNRARAHLVAARSELSQAETGQHPVAHQHLEEAQRIALGLDAEERNRVNDLLAEICRLKAEVELALERPEHAARDARQALGMYDKIDDGTWRARRGRARAHLLLAKALRRLGDETEGNGRDRVRALEAASEIHAALTGEGAAIDDSAVLELHDETATSPTMSPASKSVGDGRSGATHDPSR